MSSTAFHRTPLAVAVCTAVLGAPAGAASLLDDAAPARDLYTAADGYHFNGFDVTALPDGRFAVVWVEENDDIDQEYLKLARFDANGDAVGEPLVVRADVHASVVHRDPVAAADADGDLIVAWNEVDIMYEECSWIAFRRAAPDNTLSSIQYPDPGATSKCQVRAAMNTDGGFVLAWYSKPADSAAEYLGQTFNADGTAITSSPVHLADVGDASLPPALTLQDDTFTLAWTGQQRSLLARQFNLNGTALSSDDFRLDDGAEGTGSLTQMFPALAGDQDGGFVGLWHQLAPEDGALMFSQRGRRRAADGTAGAALEVANDALIADATTMGPMSVATDGNGLILAGWSALVDDNPASRIAAFQDGAPLGDGPVTVAATTPDTEPFSTSTRVVISGRTGTAVWYEQDTGGNAVIRARSLTVPEPGAEPDDVGDGSDSGGGGGGGGTTGLLTLLGLGLLWLRWRARR